MLGVLEGTEREGMRTLSLSSGVIGTSRDNFLEWRVVSRKERCDRAVQQVLTNMRKG